LVSVFAAVNIKAGESRAVALSSYQQDSSRYLRCDAPYSRDPVGTAVGDVVAGALAISVKFP